MTDDISQMQPMDLSLPQVSDATISQFEAREHDGQTLYEALRDRNFELALWLRRRAVELAPSDLDQRAADSTLALELLSLTQDQVIINGLIQRFSGEASTDPPPAADTQ